MRAIDNLVQADESLIKHQEPLKEIRPGSPGRISFNGSVQLSWEQDARLTLAG
jgi:hypothetical protein